jgi:hypothetical protein
MRRDKFLAMLVRMVRSKYLTEGKASELLAKFDRREIDEADLPLPLEEALTTTTQEDMQAAIRDMEAFDL